jgi:hypothetical protein
MHCPIEHSYHNFVENDICRSTYIGTQKHHSLMIYSARNTSGISSLELEQYLKEQMISVTLNNMSKSEEDHHSVF